MENKHASDMGTRAIIETYRQERRIDGSWGNCRYVKATEYRVTDLDSGKSCSFWKKSDALAYIATLTYPSLTGAPFAR